MPIVPGVNGFWVPTINGGIRKINCKKDSLLRRFLQLNYHAFIFAALTALLQGCSEDAQRTAETSNPKVRNELLFTDENNCKIYRCE